MGVGQRYQVIIEATKPLSDSNYWIRIGIAKGCVGIRPDLVQTHEERMGVLSYDVEYTNEPTTTREPGETLCRDEPYESLVPMVPWKIGRPSNERKCLLNQ